MSEEEEEGVGRLRAYVQWLFKGNPLTVALKFLWTGMYLAAFLTADLVATAVIIGAGIAVWFLWNDRENWYIETG